MSLTRIRSRAAIGLLLSLAYAVSLNAATVYVDAPPLASAISTKVGSVRGGVTQVPLITWGGDIPTIHANGDSRTTRAGSIFAKQGLDLKLVREDVFKNQLQAYIRGDSPYLRGTLGMIGMASDLLNKDPRTRPVIIYQISWSAGGDALVVGGGIKRVADLKGKRIGIQAYGPHVAYLARILADAGLGLADVKIRWLADLTATDNSPMAAMQSGGVDAAFVVIPDALAMTSGGTVGTGAEDSIRGAKILLSTKTANRIVADVYAVRSDYFKANRAQVSKFVRSLMLGQEAVAALFAAKRQNRSQFDTMIRTSAEILLDSAQAAEDTEGLYHDAELVGFAGNVKFFSSATYPRRMNKVLPELQAELIKVRLISKQSLFDNGGWDYSSLRSGLSNVAKVETPAFVPEQVASVVARKQQQGTLDDGTLFKFEVFFKPNQNQFSTDLYRDAFERMIELASTYGGAVITVEGHSDPMGYLRKKKAGANDIILGRIKQSAKNLSLSRAISVRDSALAYGKSKSISLDPSQFAVIGHGIMQPSTGICGDVPCAPKTEQAWLSNMRVEFRLIQVEAEANVFQPL